jgi:hypothetical protein
MSVTGTYLDGSIVLDEPLAIANGEHLTLMLADEEERCADGSRWPVTKAEVDAWCRRIESLPPLFDDDAEAAAFAARLHAMRQEQAAGLAARSERIAGLFAE